MFWVIAFSSEQQLVFLVADLSLLLEVFITTLMETQGLTHQLMTLVVQIDQASWETGQPHTETFLCAENLT